MSEAFTFPSLICNSEPHRLPRLEAVLCGLTDELIARVEELEDQKGVLVVTTDGPLDAAEQDQLRDVWHHLGRECREDVTFQLVGEK